jgi:hypothetical protein
MRSAHSLARLPELRDLQGGVVAFTADGEDDVFARCVGKLGGRFWASNQTGGSNKLQRIRTLSATSWGATSDK